MAAGTSVFDFFDAATRPAGPWAPNGSNVTETGKLVYNLMNTPADAWKSPVAVAAAKRIAPFKAPTLLSLRGAPWEAPALRAPSPLRIVDAAGRILSLVTAPAQEKRHPVSEYPEPAFCLRMGLQ